VCHQPGRSVANCGSPSAGASHPTACAIHVWSTGTASAGLFVHAVSPHLHFVVITRAAVSSHGDGHPQVRGCEWSRCLVLQISIESELLQVAQAVKDNTKMRQTNLFMQFYSPPSDTAPPKMTPRGSPWIPPTAPRYFDSPRTHTDAGSRSRNRTVVATPIALWPVH
jgi:hypothetical protein